MIIDEKLKEDSRKKLREQQQVINFEILFTINCIFPNNCFLILFQFSKR